MMQDDAEICSRITMNPRSLSPSQSRQASYTDFSFVPRIAAGISLLASLSILPSFCFSPVYDAYGYRRRDVYIPVPAFVCLSFLAFLATSVALAFSLALWIIARHRFEEIGAEASLGLCVSDDTPL